MAAASRTKGTAAYARRQKRIAARRSTKPVGASLSPEAMSQYITDYYDEQDKRAQIASDLQDAEIADPLARRDIQRNYARGFNERGENLAERGLSARGIQRGDISDLERTRVEATQEHELKMRTIRANATAAIQRLNDRRTVLDKNAAALAGQSIQAGTGIYAGRRPKGWTPPALGGQQGTGQVAPGAKPPPPAGEGTVTGRPVTKPTGARGTLGVGFAVKQVAKAGKKVRLA